MIGYLQWRVDTERNEEIELNFLLVGHTKFGPDRFFGIFKTKYARENIDCYDDVVRCCNTSSPNGFNVAVTVDNNFPWKDYDSFVKKYYTTVKGISKYHHFTFKKS